MKDYTKSAFDGILPSHTYIHILYLVAGQDFTMFSYSESPLVPIHVQNVPAVLDNSLCHCVSRVTRGKSISACEAS